MASMFQACHRSDQSIEHDGNRDSESGRLYWCAILADLTPLTISCVLARLLIGRSKGSSSIPCFMWTIISSVAIVLWGQKTAGPIFPARWQSSVSSAVWYSIGYRGSRQKVVKNSFIMPTGPGHRCDSTLVIFALNFFFLSLFLSIFWFSCFSLRRVLDVSLIHCHIRITPQQLVVIWWLVLACWAKSGEKLNAVLAVCQIVRRGANCFLWSGTFARTSGGSGILFLILLLYYNWRAANRMHRLSRPDLQSGIDVRFYWRIKAARLSFEKFSSQSTRERARISLLPNFDATSSQIIQRCGLKNQVSPHSLTFSVLIFTTPNYNPLCIEPSIPNLNWNYYMPYFSPKKPYLIF